MRACQASPWRRHEEEERYYRWRQDEERFSFSEDHEHEDRADDELECEDVRQKKEN